MQASPSRLYVPYRPLGLICNNVPLVLRPLPKRHLNTVICAIGNCFVTYNAETLRPISTSNALPADIRCLAADGLYVYAGCDRTVYALHLSRQVSSCFNVYFLNCFG